VSVSRNGLKQGATPMSRDPIVAQAIAASDAEVAAILAGDIDLFAESIAEDAVVNSPLNRINRRDDTLAVFRKGFIRYDSFDRRIEYAGRLGEFVLVMGDEILSPKDGAPNAGKIVHRRFTDIWRNEAGTWRLAARQATITKIE
jgi:ketosteroid isomerase-like protein